MVNRDISIKNVVLILYRAVVLETQSIWLILPEQRMFQR